MRLLFKQLGGERKTLELSSHAAPFGRSHGDTAVADAVELRESEVYVAGSDEPVRHIFGLKNEPWEFHGRFSDYWGGEGFAMAKAAEVKRFIAAKQTVHVSWGEALSGVGLILRFDPERETDREIKWKLKVAVNSDDLLGQVIDIPKRKAPADYINQILLASTEIRDAFKEMKLKVGVFDFLDSLISNLSNITGFAVGIAQELQSFESQFIGTLRRFRTTLGQLKTAAGIAREAVDSFSVDLAIESRNANDQLVFLRGQALISDSAIRMIQLSADADRQAAIAERGQILAIYSARGGDTFESISAIYYGSAVRAQDIRAANGVAPGASPQPGIDYVIPI